MNCPSCGKEIEIDLLGAPVEKGGATREFIAVYVDAFKTRWGTSPVIDKASSGQAKLIVSALGIEKARQYVQVYLQMPDAYFIGRKHDLATLRASLNKVAVAAETGRVTSAGQAKQSERSAANAASIRRAIDRGR